jgi:hypothetical protein
MIKIYCLKDPITNEIRYIGKTKLSLKSRLCLHCTSDLKTNSKKVKWIHELLITGYKPKIELLRYAKEYDSHFWERKLIREYKNNGYDLLNIKEGGDGGRYFNIYHYLSLHDGQRYYTKNKKLEEKIKGALINGS